MAVEDDNARLLARSYGTDPAAGAAAIAAAIIGRSSVPDQPADRAAVRAVLHLALGPGTFRALQLQDPVNAAALGRMTAAAEACQPARPADIIVEVVVRDLHRTMFPPPGARPAAAADSRSWAAQWWATHVRRG